MLYMKKGKERKVDRDKHNRGAYSKSDKKNIAWKESVLEKKWQFACRVKLQPHEIIRF